MSIQCPLCARRVAPAAEACRCGYRLVDGDATRAIMRAEKLELRAGRALTIGIRTMLLLPVMAAVLVLAHLWFAFDLFWLQLLVGALLTAGGTLAMTRAAATLERARDLGKLPPADALELPRGAAARLRRVASCGVARQVGYARGVAVDCPVCGCVIAEQPRVCGCGYNFATRDVGGVIDRALVERRAALGTRRRGLAALALAPLTAILGVVSVFITVWLTALILVGILPVQLFAGLIWVAHGGLGAHRAQRRLGAAASLSELPIARLVE